MQEWKCITNLSLIINLSLIQTNNIDHISHIVYFL